MVNFRVCNEMKERENLHFNVTLNGSETVLFLSFWSNQYALGYGKEMGFIFPKCLPGAMERDNGVLGGVLGEFFAKFLVKLLVVFLVLFLLYLIWAGLLVLANV